MLKIEGLETLQRELTEAARAMESFSGVLDTVRFDPHDPGSIEAAIAEVNRMIDARLGPFVGNSIIDPLIEEMKGKFRDSLLEKAAASRLESDQA